MYCPKCGLQQVAENSRFCSRCGMPISGLTDWLASYDRMLTGREAEAAGGAASPKRTGIRRGAKLMFLSGILLPIFFAFSFVVDSPGPLFVPLTVFMAGLSVLLYAVLFSEDILPAKFQPAKPASFGPMFGNAALPPAANIGMNTAAGPQVRTAELAQPPSVTEHTTKFLDRD
jgi:hypothetical protein